MCYLEKLFGELMKERALRLNNFEDNYKTKATDDGSHHTRSDAAVRIEIYLINVNTIVRTAQLIWEEVVIISKAGSV